jgi:hypothetical protein
MGLEVIDKKEFDKMELDAADEIKSIAVNEKNIDKLMESMLQPVDRQRELAVSIKEFLDKRMLKEKESESGVLSDHTRRWVETYNEILEKIQKALYGDKSVNLHLHGVVSHSSVAAKIRRAEKIATSR